MSDSFKMACPQDRLDTINAHKCGKMSINWGIYGSLSVKGWAAEKKWPTPFFGFKKAFIAKMLESDENFSEALTHSGIDVYIPIKSS